MNGQGSEPVHLQAHLKCITYMYMHAQVSWALAKLHHRPTTVFTASLLAAAQPRLASFTADALASLLWSLAESSPTLLLAAGEEEGEGEDLGGCATGLWG